MRNLSLADREWLYRIHVDANPRRFTDDLFLRACGVQTLGGGRSSDGISRLLQIYVLDGTWPEGIAEERETELREAVFAKFMKNCQETNIESLLTEDEKQAAHDEDIKRLAERIAKHEAPGIPEDGTVRLLRAAGIPITAENWMRLQFMGNPPTTPLDGELLASLPDWVRQELEPEETEAADPVCGLEDEDADDICDASSAGGCGEPSHTPVDPDEDVEED